MLVKKAFLMRLQTANHIKPSFLFQDAAESTTHGVLVTNVVQSANLRHSRLSPYFTKRRKLNSEKPEADPN